MTGFIRCSCCNAPIAVGDDDVGLSVSCPRTGRMIPVRESEITVSVPAPAAAAPPPPRPEPVAPPRPPEPPVRRTLPPSLAIQANPGLPRQEEPSGSTRLFVAGGALFAALVAIVGVVLWQMRPAERTVRRDEPAISPQPKEEPTPPISKPSTPEPRPVVPAPEKPVVPTPVVIPPQPVAIAPEPREVVVVATAPPPREKETTVATAPPPNPPGPEPKPPEPMVPEGPPKLDAHGFAIHSLAKRLDSRTSDELEKSLLAMREISLDPLVGPTRVSTNLATVAKEMKKKNLIFSGTVLAAGGRPDLAGLPFRMGLDSILVPEKAQAMNALSKELRTSVQSCIPSADDPRPNTEELFATLISEKKGGFRNRDKDKWNRAEAVPCVVQMLQAENRDVRRMSCELLAKVEAREATEALAKWAVFDTDAGNRAAAVRALGQRNRAEAAAALARHLQYPWPRAVEHACEALVALNAQEALPALARAYGQQDPDAPFRVDLPNKVGGFFRREVVRVNHPRNCIMCHTPSSNQSDLVRGAVPNPENPLPPPATVPSYYNGGGQFVAAEVTYLQQDFSLVQPVVNPGNWPGHQRYDYFVAVRPNDGAVKEASGPNGEYRSAVRFALKELSGRDPDQSADWLDEQRKKAGESRDSRMSDVAKYVSLTTNPEALAALKNQEFVKPMLNASPDEISAGVVAMQKAHGVKASRLALIAYLDPLTRTGEPGQREKARKLLEVVLGDTTDAKLAKAMKTAIE
jgi:hypothetical protein